MPRHLSAAGGDAIIADALVDPVLGLQRPGEIGAENAAQRDQHEGCPQRPFEAGVRQREIGMRDEGGDQQIADKNMDLPPARGGFRRQAGRFDGDVERELQAHAASQHPAVEIARVAERVAIDPDEPEQAAGNRRDQKALYCLAGEISRRARTASTDRDARRAPPRRSQAPPQNHPSRWFFPHQPHSGSLLAVGRDQLAAPASLAVPLNLSGPGIRLSSPDIVLPSYFSVMLVSSLETPSAAVVRKPSLFNFSPAE